MKKILSIAVIAIMTVVLCVSANAASLVNHSFDTIYLNDEQLVDNGAAKAWSEENPIDAEITTLRVRGWAHVADSTIAAFGYKVGDGEAVTDPAFIFDRPDVQNAFGVEADVANGFDITLDLANVGKGAHTVTIVVLTADGELIDVTDFTVTQQLEGDGSGEVDATPAPTPEETNPGTADASVIAIAALGIAGLAGVIVTKKIKR